MQLVFFSRDLAEILEIPDVRLSSNAYKGCLSHWERELENPESPSPWGEAMILKVKHIRSVKEQAPGQSESAIANLCRV
jgi:hypothetical protein